MALTEQERDRFRAVIWEQPPVERMGTLLTLSKVVEQQTTGELHEVAQYLTTAMVVVLTEHAGELLGEACAELVRESDKDALAGLNEIATTPEAERLLEQFPGEEVDDG